MQLTRVYKAESLAKWKEGLEAYVQGKLQDTMKLLDIGEASARDLLKQNYARTTQGPDVDHVIPERVNKVQKFSPSLIERGVHQGYISTGDGKITFKTPPGTPPVVYKIVELPGEFRCCHCNALVDGDPKNAKAHIDTQHPNTPSPDSNNPSGWKQELVYTCELVEG